MFESVLIHFHSRVCMEIISFISTGNATPAFCLVELWETAGPGATGNTGTHRWNDQSKRTQGVTTTLQEIPYLLVSTVKVELQKHAIIKDNVSYKMHPGKLIQAFFFFFFAVKSVLLKFCRSGQKLHLNKTNITKQRISKTSTALASYW